MWIRIVALILVLSPIWVGIYISCVYMWRKNHRLEEQNKLLTKNYEQLQTNQVWDEAVSRYGTPPEDISERKK